VLDRLVDQLLHLFLGEERDVLLALANELIDLDPRGRLADHPLDVDHPSAGGVGIFGGSGRLARLVDHVSSVVHKMVAPFPRRGKAFLGHRLEGTTHWNRRRRSRYGRFRPDSERWNAKMAFFVK